MLDLKPLHEQVVVITGGSSGIGREAAMLFAENGAAVVPLARGREALETLAVAIERMGGTAHPVVADVSDWDAMRRAADDVVERFGRIDTWVNNAAASLYGTVEDSSVEEIHRVVDVILMGQVHGVKAALPHLQRQGRGAIINVASALALRSVPLQAAYCAAKHGVKGFTESLRLELERDAPGVSVTLIVPSSINTPLFDHARSKLGVRPKPLPPVYEPRVVAQAIVYAATARRREITVGGAGKMLDALERLEPRLADAYLRGPGNAFEQQKTDAPDHGRDNLFAPVDGPGSTTGRFGTGSKSRSMYTRLLEEQPGRKGVLAAAAGLGVVSAAVAVSLLGRTTRYRGTNANRG